jgi:hypothetical protein
VALGLIAVSAGCAQSDPGPTAAQAGETLKSHITELMKQSDLSDADVTDPGGRDISCGDDKAKRTYGVSATFPGERPSLISQMTGGLIMTWGYKVDRVFSPESEKTILKLKEARTTITLDMPSVGRAIVLGETDCLPARG